MQIIKNTEEMSKFAQDFVKNLKPKTDKATVLGLYGDLGAGKTTFTQFLAAVFGIKENVVSPTFVIMKIYELSSHFKFMHFVHIDAYRIEKSSEMLHLGFKSIIEDPENLVVIEWPERIMDIMPEHTKIVFKHISENEREVEII